MTLAEDSPLFSDSTIVAENDEGEVRVQYFECNETFVLHNHLESGVYLDEWKRKYENIYCVDDEGELRQVSEYLSLPEACGGDFLPLSVTVDVEELVLRRIVLGMR